MLKVKFGVYSVLTLSLHSLGHKPEVGLKIFVYTIRVLFKGLGPIVSDESVLWSEAVTQSSIGLLYTLQL